MFSSRSNTTTSSSGSHNQVPINYVIGYGDHLQPPDARLRRHKHEKPPSKPPPAAPSQLQFAARASRRQVSGEPFDGETFRNSSSVSSSGYTSASHRLQHQQHAEHNRRVQLAHQQRRRRPIQLLEGAGRTPMLRMMIDDEDGDDGDHHGDVGEDGVNDQLGAYDDGRFDAGSDNRLSLAGRLIDGNSNMMDDDDDADADDDDDQCQSNSISTRRLECADSNERHPNYLGGQFRAEPQLYHNQAARLQQMDVRRADGSGPRLESQQQSFSYLSSGNVRPAQRQLVYQHQFVRQPQEPTRQTVHTLASQLEASTRSQTGTAADGPKVSGDTESKRATAKMQHQAGQPKRKPQAAENGRKLRPRSAKSAGSRHEQDQPPDLGCCGKLAKSLLFIINLIFWSSGLALGAWGILALVEDHKNNLSQLLVFEPSSRMSLFQLLSWSFITLGCATVLVGVCGCSALFKNNRWILGLYIFLILAIFALDLATGLLAMIFQERLVASVRLRLANKLRSEYGVQASFTAAVDYIQTKYECCGLEGHFDYDQSLWRLQRLGGFEATVARTCCHLRNTFDDQAHVNPRPVNESMCQSTDVRFHQSYRYRRGCLDDLERLIRHKIWTFTLGCAGVGALILLSLFLATCFCRSIGGRDSSRQASQTSAELAAGPKQQSANNRHYR